MKSKTALCLLLLLLPGAVAAQPRSGTNVPPVPPPKVYKQYVAPPPTSTPTQSLKPSPTPLRDAAEAAARMRERAPLRSSGVDAVAPASLDKEPGTDARPSADDRQAQQRRGASSMTLSVTEPTSPALRAVLLQACTPPRCSPPPAVADANSDKTCRSGDCDNGTGVQRLARIGPDPTIYFFDGPRQYEGEFKSGKMEGSGKVFDWHGNLVFTGTFKGGQPEGVGIRVFYFRGKLDRAYEGGFHDGKQDGFGIYTRFSDSGSISKIYAGDWKAGDEEGNGKEYVWGDPAPVLVFEGTFRKGKRHGKGKETKKGVVSEGEWVDGEKNAP